MRSLLYHPGFSTGIPRGKRMTAAIFCYSRAGCETHGGFVGFHRTIPSAIRLRALPSPAFCRLKKASTARNFRAAAHAHFHRRVRHRRAGDCALRPQQKDGPGSACDRRPGALLSFRFSPDTSAGQTRWRRRLPPRCMPQQSSPPRPTDTASFPSMPGQREMTARFPIWRLPKRSPLPF